MRLIGVCSCGGTLKQPYGAEGRPSWTLLSSAQGRVRVHMSHRVL